MASSLINTNSVFDFDPDDLMNTYSLVVTCEISPTSSAEYCEVIAKNDDTAISGKLCDVRNYRSVCVQQLHTVIYFSCWQSYVHAYICTSDATV